MMEHDLQKKRAEKREGLKKEMYMEIKRSYLSLERLKDKLEEVQKLTLNKENFAAELLYGLPEKEQKGIPEITEKTLLEKIEEIRSILYDYAHSKDRKC